MTSLLHTYGRNCLLAENEPELSSLYTLSTLPEIRPQFFYISSLPIDDPLAPLPASSGQATGNERTPPTPFSARDNIALESAWLELGRDQRDKGDRSGSHAATSREHGGIAVPGYRHKLATREDASLLSSDASASNSAYLQDDYVPHRTRDGSKAAQPSSSRTESRTDRAYVGSSLHDESKGESAESSSNQKRERSTSLVGGQPAKRRNSLQDDDEGLAETSSPRANRSRDVSISGSPFARTSSPQSDNTFGRSLESLHAKDGNHEWQPEVRNSTANRLSSKPSGLRTTVNVEETETESAADGAPSEESEEALAKIVVGASRLHSVELPGLQMKPIYWNPLHDISNVIRATWFFKNTMLPVETAVANKLEEGYAELKPWTDTWQDELNSCVENGAEAETKIVHRLWPKVEPGSANPPSTAHSSKDAKAHPNEIHEELEFDKNQAAGGTAAHADAIKPYLTSSVIYVDARNAQILRPSLLPSASRNRRPLSAIRKHRQIGIPVVRGFSRKLWEQINPSKPNPVDVRQYIRRAQSQDFAAAPGEQICYACRMEELRPNPTDLVFVIHGIGQKLSERMESFHFTHAINEFRRQVNVETFNEPVWPNIRPDHGGTMVLPINWRATLSLEDQVSDGTDTDDPFANDYSLNDITPETLPAVRSLISDVMLDIPYYLSHHKPKMIKAVVKEANRIYRIWCQNNAGFQETGRVHLVAHSLGSVMAMDILSHQPTNVPRFNFSETALHSDIFEFDTRNLFLCGSPVGFFLLLHKANLLPRKGRSKAGIGGDDLLQGVAGEAGQYGCVAVDNLYNIMHTTDPIAYRVNAAVDKDLSNSLKDGTIPSSTPSWSESFSSVFRWNSMTTFTTSTPVRPSTMTKLPSTVEMETHDFTREEIAEKRMLCLNDNGQIDYYLSGGGGALNIQYLNMLSAHSSYWTLTDFVRFFVVEIARKQGRDGTLVAFRAEKKKGYKHTKS